MKGLTPYNKPHYRMSKCCQAPTLTIPACFGDPSSTICSICHKHTEIITKPVFEEVSKGVYRKINYGNENR